LDKYFEYHKGIYEDLTKLRDKIKSSKDLKKFSKELKSLEKEITLFHAIAVNKIVKKSKVKIDFVGFHGQTIFHNPSEKISIQLGNGRLLSKLTKKNVDKIAKNFEVIVDGSDNFRTRFLINDYCLENKKILVSGAINRFDGQVYTFNFSKEKSPCLRCFMPNIPIDSDDNCETEGVLGTLAGIVGSIQANEVVKEILGIGDTLCGHILIIDALKLTFRKVKLNRRSDCSCYEKK